MVPGVLFGKTTGSIPVQLDAKAFEPLYHEAGRTSVVKVSVDGGEPTSVIIKTVQRNPLTGRALHVDFFALDLTQEMQVDIPLVFTGSRRRSEDGGHPVHLARPPKVKALPADLPHEITSTSPPLVDLEATIHVRDLPVAANVTVLNDPDELVAKVMPPRDEEEPEPVVAEGEEGPKARGCRGRGGRRGREAAAEGGSGDEETELSLCSRRDGCIGSASARQWLIGS